VQEDGNVNKDFFAFFELNLTEMLNAKLKRIIKKMPFLTKLYTF